MGRFRRLAVPQWRLAGAGTAFPFVHQQVAQRAEHEEVCEQRPDDEARARHADESPGHLLFSFAQRRLDEYPDLVEQVRRNDEDRGPK